MRVRRTASPIAALCLAGCASALQPIDAGSDLARTDGADPAAAAALAEEAARLFEQRPDRAAVELAAERWRQAAIAAPAISTSGPTGISRLDNLANTSAGAPIVITMSVTKEWS